jgi:hypothetical protein
VSLSWRDRIAVYLGPDAVQVARYPAGLRRAPAECHRIAFEAPGERWQNLLEALRAALALLSKRRGDARVVVSNHYVRFALVPDAGKLRNHNERLVAARHTLQAVYGDAAARWRVALDDARGKGAAIAAGIDADLVDGIVAALTAVHLPVQTVRPLFAAAATAARRTLGTGPAWFGVAEPGRLALAYVERGAWQSLRTHRLRTALNDELPVLLEQNRLTGSTPNGAGTEGGRVVLATSDGTAVEPGAGPWSIQSVALELPGRAW